MQESTKIFEEKYVLLPVSMLSKIHQSKFTLIKREMGNNGDQGENSKSQRTTKVRLPFAEASLPKSLCPEMCMICKKKDLKLKHSRQLQ